MHIALVSPGWPLRKHGNGIVTYVHWLRQDLIRQGHQVSVFAGAVDEPEEGVFLVRPSFRYRSGAWWEARRGVSPHPVLRWGKAIASAIRTVHRKHPIDVIEMEESFGWCADVIRDTSIPTVVKLHGPAFMTLLGAERESTFSKIRVACEGAALRKVQVLISPSRHTLQTTIDHYCLTPPISRTVVNPLSLPQTTRLWSLERCDRKKLLFVGRFDEIKGGDLMLRAFKNLLASDPRLTLVFVGPDAGIPMAGGGTMHFDVLKSTLFPGDDSARVDYRGRLPPAQIHDLRTEALVTIVASRQENQSYTALEAMLQGCPLVSTDVGGQSEIIADGVTGLLAKAGSADDLAAKIRMLVNDPERAAQLGRSARAHVLVQHCPARVVAETLAVYTQAISLARQGSTAAESA